ncbi:CLIP domain-containing serine protease B4-like [Zophobas morio]|uniref:CLIP domain-containing serine protease B4-like n=1 Tax=Zophobas morio TaxID=2755281 RepID=UPI003083A58C
MEDSNDLSAGALHAGHTSETEFGNPCTLKSSNSSGVCKLLKECEAVQDEVKSGHNAPQTCGNQGIQSVVCCPNSRRPEDITERKCREYSSYIQEKQLCGHKIVQVIVGGQRPVERKEFPHVAVLGYQNEDSGNLTWLCGGSLISEEYILTAAHCILPGGYPEPKSVLCYKTSTGRVCTARV